MKMCIRTHKDLVDGWEHDLAVAEKGDEIRIVSGEAPYFIFQKLKNDFIDTKNRTNAKIKMIGGPIISVSDQKTNDLFDLINGGVIEFWVSPYRQSSHYRIIGMRQLFKEEFHLPCSEERIGKYISDPFVITRYIYDFENLITSLKLTQYQDSRIAQTKSVKEIVKLRDRLGRNYDFLATLVPN